MRLFLRSVPPADHGMVLDLACGAGRHLAALRRAGCHTVGLDLSLPLLQRAARATAAPLVCGDMRSIPFRSSVLAGLTSFFTSFGYFSTREEDLLALKEMRRVLKRGGSFMLDYLNAGRVRRELVPEEVGVVDGRRVWQQRVIEENTVVKTIRIEDSNAEKGIREYQERVRLYEEAELRSLLQGCGLAPTCVFGDYDGGRFSVNSPRLILAGRAR